MSYNGDRIEETIVAIVNTVLDEVDFDAKAESAVEDWMSNNFDLSNYSDEIGDIALGHIDIEGDVSSYMRNDFDISDHLNRSIISTIAEQVIGNHFEISDYESEIRDMVDGDGVGEDRFEKTVARIDDNHVKNVRWIESLEDTVEKLESKVERLQAAIMAIGDAILKAFPLPTVAVDTPVVTPTVDAYDRFRSTFDSVVDL